jgi:hypothetical protein
VLATASQLVLATLALAWIGSVAAVARDAHARLENRAGRRAAAALAALLPFVGSLVWLCVRPAETRLDRRERRLRAAVLERQLSPPVLSPPARAAAEPAPARAA